MPDLPYGERYWLADDFPAEGPIPPWREVTREDFVRAERGAGFRSKFGPGEVATAGFSSTAVPYQGTVTYGGKVVEDPIRQGRDVVELSQAREASRG